MMDVKIAVIFIFQASAVRRITVLVSFNVSWNM